MAPNATICVYWSCAWAVSASASEALLKAVASMMGLNAYNSWLNGSEVYMVY